ncbi:hypothetical protein FPQ18DRAFT_327801, partial [Pyronema domesticum]
MCLSLILHVGVGLGGGGCWWLLVVADCWSGFWLLCCFSVVCQQHPKTPLKKIPLATRQLCLLHTTPSRAAL